MALSIVLAIILYIFWNIVPTWTKKFWILFLLTLALYEFILFIHQRLIH